MAIRAVIANLTKSQPFRPCETRPWKKAFNNLFFGPKKVNHPVFGKYEIVWLNEKEMAELSDHNFAEMIVKYEKERAAALKKGSLQE